MPFEKVKKLPEDLSKIPKGIRDTVEAAQRHVREAEAKIAELERIAAKNPYEASEMAGYAAAKANLKAYSPGGKFYQDALRDYNLYLAEQAAKPLGISGAQLLANPELLDNPELLAGYKEIKPNLPPTPTPTPTPQVSEITQTPQLGQELPFPTTQEQMAEYQQKHTFVNGKWYAGKGTQPTQATSQTITQKQQPVSPGTLAQPQAGSYQIRPGDTLSAIAAQYGVSIADIMALNPQITDPNRIYAGQTLKLPVTRQRGAIEQPTGAIGTGIGTGTGAGTGTEAGVGAGTGTMSISDAVKLLAQHGIEFSPEMLAAMTGQEAPDIDEIRDEIYTKYGIDPDKVFEDRPEKGFEEIYSEAYKQSGLADIKKEIDDLRAKIADTEADRDEAIETINENPWLSEASRVGRVGRVQDKAQRELNRLTNQLTLAVNAYERGKEDAKDVATRALTAYAREREWDMEELDYYITRAEADIQARIAEEEMETQQEIFRYFPEYLEALPEVTPERETQVVEVGGRKKLIDTQTGETIKDLGLAELPEGEATTVTTGSGVDIELGTRDLPAGDAKLLGEGIGLPKILDDLRDLIKANERHFGLIAGRIPSKTKAKITDDLKRATQVIGRFMEGGVLRKEDEIKYRKMLPQLSDWNADVALDKLEGVRKLVADKYVDYLESYNDAGYDVSRMKMIDMSLRHPITGEVKKVEGMSYADYKEALALGFTPI